METTERYERMINTGLRIGQHVGPGGKHLLNTLAQALDGPASALQCFPGAPNRYWGAKCDPAEVEAFKEKSHGIFKVAHSVFILNIAEDPDSRSGKMTRHSLVNQLEWCERAGFHALVFHPGSVKDHDRSSADIARVILKVQLNWTLIAKHHFPQGLFAPTQSVAPVVILYGAGVKH